MLNRDNQERVHFDTLGRAFLTVAQNIKNGADEFIETRTDLDIEGNPLKITDARGNPVMQYKYAVSGETLFTDSMDAGQRWLLLAADGKPLRAWDSPMDLAHNARRHQVRTEYDPLRRPLESHVLFEDIGNEILAQRSVYGESQPNPHMLNLRGKVYQSFDDAGIVTNEEFDFKGNLLRSNRQLVQKYRRNIDWNAPPAPEGEPFTVSTEYDALNRPVRITSPDGSMHVPDYNEANFPERMQVFLRGALTPTDFVRNIDYNEKGQRVLIEYGLRDENGNPIQEEVKTDYTYDPLTFRLTNLKTTRTTDGKQLQDLRYTYDPVGNITEIYDHAQNELVHDGEQVLPNSIITMKSATFSILFIDWAASQILVRSSGIVVINTHWPIIGY